MTKIISIGVPAVRILALLLLAPGVRAEDEAPPPRSSVEVFDALYAQVEEAVAEGRLPAETAKAADEIAFDLQRELIRRDAEIEVSRLEAARFEGERQQRALDRLIAAAAARERLLLERIRRLEDLAGTSAGLPAADVPPVSSVPLPPEDDPAEALEPAADEASEGRELKLKVTFEPEDPIESPEP